MRAHYTDDGVLPRTALIDNFLANRAYLTFHILHGSLVFQAALFCLAGLAAAALIFGFRTRSATVAVWILTCSLQARNPFILHGGDDVLRMMLFWGMFVPLGARWSIDRAASGDDGVEPTGDCSWGSAGLLLQLCFVYLFSGALKSHPAWRSEGTAVYLALSIDQFATPIGKALLPYHNLLRALTFSTLALEIAGPFAALFTFDNPRVRTLIVAAFMGFHIGLGLCIELGMFPAICISAWLAFLPGLFWDRIEKRTAPMWARRRAGGTAERMIAPISEFLMHRASTRRFKLSIIGNAAAAAALAYVFLWNARAVDFKRMVHVFPKQLNVIGELLRIDQYWNLFAPYPTLEHGWYVVYARLRDGEEVDLLTGKGVMWAKPELVSATYKNERWRKYLMNLANGEYSRYRPYYAQYLHRAWDESQPPARQLAHMEIIFISETALPHYKLSPRTRNRLWNQDWYP